MLSTSHQVFLEVADNLSFSKAAKALFISQPAISRHIKLLEDHYQFALFERTGNYIRLTPVGEKIYAYLNEAKEIQRRLEFEISSLKTQSNAAGSFKLGASTTLALYIIPPLLSSFLKLFPKVQVQVINRNAENIMQALVQKQIDFGVVEVENKVSAFEYEYFTSDQIIVVCSPFNPLAKKKELSMDELINSPIALRENGSGTHTAIALALKKLDISIAQLNTKVRLGGTEALKNYLLADQCLGFLPQNAIKKELSQGDLVELHVPNFKATRDFFFVKRKGENFNLTKKFISFCKNSVATANQG